MRADKCLPSLFWIVADYPCSAWTAVSSMNKPDGTLYLTMHTYRITSTAISVLAAQKDLAAAYWTASFGSKCTIQDVTTGESVDGGATLQVTMTDGDKGTAAHMGVGDGISIYVLKKNGGVWFANKLDGTLKAVESPVVTGTGDIVVK